jgi:hypothetical protein
MGKRQFFLPRQLANEVDPNTGKQCLSVCINAKKYFYPVEEFTPIDYESSCLLKDIGIFSSDSIYTSGEFNPFENEPSKA